eukprot:g2408.t1 g2408   contig12:41018-42763(+)
MAKQSSIKTTTWADQAQGFAFPLKQPYNLGGYGNRYASLDESRSSVRDTTPSQDDSKRPYRDNGKDYVTSQRREVYGRGGGRGRGRGQHRGPSTNYRGGAPVPLPPIRHREYTEEFLGALISLLKLPATHPITMDGLEYASFSSNERTLLLLHIAAERGSKFWSGDKFDLADRWAFSHPEDIVAAINDQKIMQRTVSRFSVETDLFPQFNARSSPLQYTTMIGELIEKLGVARQEDATLTSKPSRKIIFEIMTVYITRMIGDGSDERKLFDMLKSAPPKNLVTMLTSPNALYFFLYQRGEEKWGDSNKFEWNPLRVQRNVDFARITLDPLTDDLLTPTSPSPEGEEATPLDSEDIGGDGGDIDSDRSPQPTSFSARGVETCSMVHSDRMLLEQKLRDPTKHMNLDLLRLSQMCESNEWKSAVYPAIESYLIEHYSPHHADILTQVQLWRFPVLMWYLREPGALAEAVREMGLERRKAIRDGVANAHHLRMYGRDLHSSNEVASYLVTLTGTLRNGSIAGTVREWAEYVLPLVHSMHHTMRIEPISSDRSGASLYDALSLPTADRDLLERYARLQDCTATDR